MTVGELGERMSSRELSEWKAYYALEPFGDEPADIRHAQAMVMFAGAHGARRKLTDFRLFAKDEPSALTGADLAAKFDAAIGLG